MKLWLCRLMTLGGEFRRPLDMCATIYRQLFKSLVELDDFPIFYMGNVSMVNRA